MKAITTSAILAGALLAATLTTTASSASPRPCTPAWHQVPTSNVIQGSLASVSAPAPGDAWFTFSDPFGWAPYWNGHWDGHSVNTVPQPIRAPGAGLTGRGSSFDSPADGWLLVEPVLGQSYGIGSFSLAEHWTGGHWKLTSTAVNPHFSTSRQGLSPVAVASLSPRDAWMAGGYDATFTTRGAGEAGALIEHWDGTHWTIVANPDDSKNETALRAISAASPDDIWVAGYQTTPTGQVVPLTEHWDGKQWLPVATPALPATVGLAAFNAISVHGSEIWAAGYEQINGTDYPLAEHYAGGHWTVTPGLPRLTATRISGIYAAAPGDVWATAQPDYIRGTPADATGLGRPGELLHWTGRTWATVDPPGPQEYGLTYSYASIAGTGPHDIWIGGSTWNLADLSNPDPEFPLLSHLTC